MHKMILTTPSGENIEVAEYVKKWGRSASIALLDPTCEIYKSPHIDGVIGYRCEAGSAFVFGDPLCEQSVKTQLAQSFDEYCKKNNQNVVYTQVSDEFARWGLEHYKGALVQVGEEFFVDPQNNPTEGADARMLRKKINHAKHEGATVLEYTEHRPDLENEFEQAKNQWLSSRKGPQIYLSNVQLFKDRSSKRWFYALKNNRVVGLCMLNRLELKEGWVLNLLMATPDAPNGTTELLVVSVLDILRNEGCHYLTFGVVTAEDLDPILGLNPFTSWCAKKAFKGAKWIFNLDGRRKYWEKYKPQGERSHVLFTRNKISLCDVLGLMKAMNVKL